MNPELERKVEETVQKLRAPSNWLQQPRGKNWKDVVNKYDRTPFEAADLIEKLSTALQEAYELGRKEAEEEAKQPDWD